MRWHEYQSLQRISVLESRFISYVDQGVGDPVVLLHGMPTWGYLWHRLIPELAWRRRVLVPDLLGFGYSDRSDRFDRSIARQTEMIVAWLGSLGIERADFIGHDIGGGVALRLATLYPKLVGRIALLNSVSYDSWPTEAMLQLGHPEMRRRLSAQALLGLLRLAIKQGFASSPPDELLDGLLVPYSTEVGKLSLIRNASALDTNQTMEVAPRFPQIRAPALILWGTGDRFQPIKLAERLAFDIPQARLVRLERAKHFVMIDQPERVAEELRAFLAVPEVRAPAPPVSPESRA